MMLRRQVPEGDPRRIAFAAIDGDGRSASSYNNNNSTNDNDSDNNNDQIKNIIDKHDSNS